MNTSEQSFCTFFQRRKKYVFKNLIKIIKSEPKFISQQFYHINILIKTKCKIWKYLFNENLKWYLNLVIVYDL